MFREPAVLGVRPMASATTRTHTERRRADHLDGRHAGIMTVLKTNVAAERIGVSPNTLRTWERRYGYPNPRRTEGGHRQYAVADVDALRRALLETHSISSAIRLARARGKGLASPAELIEAFDRFDERAADLAMEESLIVRSVEGSVERLLLPAVEAAAARTGRDAEYEFGCRWGTGWLYAAKRLAPPAARPEAVLICDSSRSLGIEALNVQALELVLRRAGYRVLVLSPGLAQERMARALRSLAPDAILLAGSDATLDGLGRLMYAARQVVPGAPVLQYRDATPVHGRSTIPALGSSPSEATVALEGVLCGRGAGVKRRPRGPSDPSSFRHTQQPMPS